MIAAHAASRHKGKYKCKKCGRKHHTSEHWSHAKGTHKGAHGEISWFGRAKRPQKAATGRRKKTSAAGKRRGRHIVRKAHKRGGTTFGPVVHTPTKRHKATWGSMSAAEVRRAGRKARRRKNEHLVAGHLAKNPHHKGKHRVAAHLAHDPAHHGKKKARKKGKKTGARKGHRTAAQKRATAHLVAVNKRRGSHKGGAHKKARRSRKRAHGAGLPRTPWSK